MYHNWLTILLSLSLFLSCQDDLKLRGENCNTLVLCSYHVFILVSFMYILYFMYVVLSMFSVLLGLEYTITIKLLLALSLSLCASFTVVSHMDTEITTDSIKFLLNGCASLRSLIR